MNKRHAFSRRARPGLVTVVMMMAAAFGGMVIAQTRDHRQAPPKLSNLQRVGNAVQVQPAQAKGIVPAMGVGGIAAAKLDSGTPRPDIMPASLNGANAGDWAGPFSPDELHQVPRKLSPEERNALRQEIKTAGEEVYEPYRSKK